MRIASEDEIWKEWQALMHEKQARRSHWVKYGQEAAYV
jgi:hypothetical protein